MQGKQKGEKPHTSQELEQLLRLAYSAMESLPDGIIISDMALPDQPIIYINPAVERITGYSKTELIGKNCRFLQNDDREQAAVQDIRLAIQEGREEKVELRNYRKDGSMFWNELHLAPVKEEGGQVTHFIGIITDITDRKNMEKQLLFAATHDNLTHLPNKALLTDRIQQAIVFALKANNIFTLIFIDIDRFKLINDSLGHTIGDELIKIVAKRLLPCVKEGDTVARFGGDEFMIILNEIIDEQSVSICAQKILNTVSSVINIGDKKLNITASAGIVLYPRDGGDVEELLKNVDTAMYLAKDAGKNNFKFYAQDMNNKNMQRLELENDLRQAIKRQEFSLNYQTLVNLKTNLTTGVEVLIRWKRTNGDIVPPTEFISAAEETNLIIDIGNWVLDHAGLHFKQLLDKGLNKIRMAINISPRQFKEANFVSVLSTILNKRQIPATLIDLELTETILMENLDESSKRLHELKKQGFNIVVDDFGTGYSNLNYLKKLPVDKIKIDKSFIAELPKAKDNAAIVLAIVAMAKALGISVIAEGVETKEQLAFLKNNGCDEAQGYYLSKPLDIEALAKFLGC